MKTDTDGNIFVSLLFWDWRLTRKPDKTRDNDHKINA
jgi:hypothetical protein